MKTYSCNKIVKAEPMTLGFFESTRNRKMYPNVNKDSNNTDDTQYDATAEGYLVKYEDGYESWSPKAVFEAGYQCIETAKDRVQIELTDLQIKLENLQKFVDSDKFNELGEYMQKLMLEQKASMTDYVDVLEQRLQLM